MLFDKNRRDHFDQFMARNPRVAAYLNSVNNTEEETFNFYKKKRRGIVAKTLAKGALVRTLLMSPATYATTMHYHLEAANTPALGILGGVISSLLVSYLFRGPRHERDGLLEKDVEAKLCAEADKFFADNPEQAPNVATPTYGKLGYVGGLEPR